MSKTWSDRFDKGLNPFIEKFNASIVFDICLLEEDLDGSIAHARMLGIQGIITKEEAIKLENGLNQIRKEAAEGLFQPDISDLEMEKIISIMSDFEVFEKSQNMIEYHSELAIDCINNVKDSLSKWGYNQLCHLTNYLAYRLS